jgi:Arc/MetJ-type ribon-helix-helix transcriptional regulator
MSTTVEIPEEVAAQVRDLVESGAYPDTDTAFRILREQRLRSDLWSELEEADREIENGHGVEWNEETRQRIIREGRAAYERGDLPDPDVCP